MSVLGLVLVSSLYAGAVPSGNTARAVQVYPVAVAIGVVTDAKPFERHLREWSRTGVRSTRHWIRRGVRLVLSSLRMWWRWFKRALKFIVIAAVLALTEASLLSAWRTGGLPTLRTYVPLMLYVYVCLLADRRVSGRAKLLLLLSIVYGIVRSDLIPDRSLLPGLLDDVALIAFALYAFRVLCGNAAIDYWARRAVRWQQRTALLKAAHAGTSAPRSQE